MLTDWIQTALISLGIIFSTSFFLRSSFLKRKNAEKLDEISKKLDGNLFMLIHKMDSVERNINEIRLELINMTVRTSIVETRMEERLDPLRLPSTRSQNTSAVPRKRGRPPKIK